MSNDHTPPPPNPQHRPNVVTQLPGAGLKRRHGLWQARSVLISVA